MVTQRIRLLRFCRDRKSAVALMVALMAPVLIGVSALAVDATSWFGTREAMQTAADAAALSASMSGLKGTAADTVAVAAANAATGNAFNFTTASAAAGNGGAVAVAVSNAGTNSTRYTAQVSVPLKSYLLRLVPQFFAGGSASAQAAALRQARQTATGGVCILATNRSAARAINVTGTGVIDATDCAVFANSSADSTNLAQSGDAIVVAGSGKIEAPAVGAVGGIYTSPDGGYIGDTTGTAAGNGNGVYTNAVPVLDPLASMGNPPQFPTGSDFSSGGTGHVFPRPTSLSGSSLPVTYAKGTYLFEGNSRGPALKANVRSILFSGGTYYFDGGISLQAQTTITFGPGIYYIRNGDLHVGGNDTVIVNGATFVLEGNAGFIFDGSSQSLDMRAPTTNCVAPSRYPVSADAFSFPYDGTNGEGICGVLIYQARADKAASSIWGGANDTLNGIIYAPGSALTVGGGGNLSAARATDGSLGTMSLIANTITDVGSGTITASAASGSPVSKATKTVYVSSLVR